MELIDLREAEHCYDIGKYVQSARLFARTSVNFEEAALRFSHFSLSLHPPPPVVQGIIVTEDSDLAFEDDELTDESATKCLSESSHARYKRGQQHHQAQKEAAGDSSREKDLKKAAAKQVDEGEEEDDKENEEIHTSTAPLKAYLRAKLDLIIQLGAQTSKKNQDQLALLAVWLAELLLDQIGELQERCKRHPSKSAQSVFAKRQREFRSLVAHPSAILPEAKCLIYKMIESHGNDEEFIFFSKLVKGK
ncbi:unnamed protein product [Protopolystoma xenopodis]|uniref:Uncharacterized protein n=1 Tax=Protopolystoma xenopodis TaxID=117903 RepID=A0A3S5B603_9PLAT|nr:unnamed protein product [Protopolystoma xenopodis]